ncbi:MAG: PilN domain-containing protein [Zoogloeaceae bacterium]|jgi:type IV pilus assembly protein PilN|nr:PilN domain-containing protein [Zoogloeaceae bacterium]
MMRINLLPYREENRRIRRQQFYSFLGVVAVIGAGLIVLAYLGLDYKVQQQSERNDFLSREIAKLDGQIAEVTALKQEIQRLVGRKDIIESLQDDRSETILMLSEMVRRVPGGIYLTGFKQTNKDVEINGYTQSSSRVSTLMENIENSPWMEGAYLIQIKAVIVNNRPMGNFSLRFRLVKEKAAKGTDGAVAGGGQQ